jgi:hypothetical protein
MSVANLDFNRIIQHLETTESWLTGTINSRRSLEKFTRHHHSGTIPPDMRLILRNFDGLIMQMRKNSQAVKAMLYQKMDQTYLEDSKKALKQAQRVKRLVPSRST